MIDSQFYLTRPMPNDRISLVAVILYDFQDRKFLPRKHKQNEEIIQEVRDVEYFLLRFKTKLAASLSRFRIKHSLASVDCMLPESVKRKQKMSANLPLYAWVNTLKCSLDEVQSALRHAGFSQVNSIGQLEGQAFCQDPHCRDTLVFPAQLKAQLSSTKLHCDHKLILQDKSCSLGPNAAYSLLPEEGDVLMVGCFSGLTVSHMAVLMAQKLKTDGNYQPMVYVCISDCTEAQREELQRVVCTMDCRNVKVIQEVFSSLDFGDKRLRKVRVILLIPRCSVSTVSNPVEFILQENGDTDLLLDLSRGSIAPSKLESLAVQQRKDLDHAFKFPNVMAVVYCTCSSYSEETVDVVNTALQKFCSDQEGKPRRKMSFRPSPSPFSTSDHGEATEDMQPFFLLELSEQSNGCFVAVLKREPEPVIQETAEEVIARANAKGILDKIGSNNPIKKEHRGNNNRMKKPAQARCSQPHLSVSVQSRNQLTKSSSSAALCGRQDFQQASRGEPKALGLQAALSSFSSSKREPSSSSSSSSKTDKSSPSKLINPVLNTPHSTTSAAPDPACPLPSHPRRAQQEVLKPVMLVLPRIHFPSSFPPQHIHTRFSPSFNMRRTPAHFVPRGPSKDFNDGYRPLF